MSADDLNSFLAGLGISSVGAVGGGLALASDEVMALDPDLVLTTRDEERIDYSGSQMRGGGRGSAPPEGVVVTETVPEMTVRDFYDTYKEMDPDTQAAFQRRMFTSNMYNASVDADEIGQPRNVMTALGRTVQWAAFNDANPFDVLPDLAMPEAEQVEEPVARFRSVAQIEASADAEAARLLGRRATDAEKSLAVSIIRGFESEGQTPTGADLAAAFRERSPREVAARGMEQTMQLFKQIIGG